MEKHFNLNTWILLTLTAMVGFFGKRLIDQVDRNSTAIAAHETRITTIERDVTSLRKDEQRKIQ